jgi:hypothetical protein
MSGLGASLSGQISLWLGDIHAEFNKFGAMFAFDPLRKFDLQAHSGRENS